MKAKRKLTNFNFEKSGAHVALVGKHQGGPANGYTTLLTKATEGIPQAFVEKADMVRVTLTIQEFLRRFFGMYYEDAEILARILGYETDTDDENSYEEYIQSKIDSVEIMKSLFKAEDMAKALSEVTEDQFETLLTDQLMIEKAMSSKAKIKEGVSKQNVDKPKEDVTKMSQENQEMIAKSELESLIQKAVAQAIADKDSELNKAQDLIKSFEEDKAKQVEKARKAALKDAVVDDEKVEVLMKSFASLTEEDFNSSVETLKALTKASEEGSLFTEKGVDTEQQEPAAKQSATAAYLAKKYPQEK